LALIVAGHHFAELFRVTTGSVSRSLCAAVFISGIDPEQVYEEEQLPEDGMHRIAWALHYEVDLPRREVRATVLRAFGARAVFRKGLGCLLVRGDEPVPDADGVPTEIPSAPPGANALAEPGIVSPASPALIQALDEAFAEPNPARPRRTKALVVVHDGQLIAERYAPGYSPETPVWGHSLTKSVISALIGILARDEKLPSQLSNPAPLAAWQAANDPHHAISVAQLLRMTSGLPFDETEPINPAIRMWFLEPDMAGFAARTPITNPPGAKWGYSNLGYLILSRLVRDAEGGNAKDADAFIRRELFSPLGMRSAQMTYDVTGTPVGASHMWASARDWARFGQLYLDDGVAGGRRILPEGWARYSASQTLDTGYGAGFWTNLVNEGSVPIWDAPWGMPELPKDMFYARGYLGQFIVIVPSERLVVARFGLTHGGSGIGAVIAHIITALHASKGEP